MLRVLHCIYDDQKNPWVGGGGAARAHEIYRRLRRELQTEVVTGNYVGARDETIDGVHYRRLGLAAPYALSRASYALAAGALLRVARYDAAIFDFSSYTPIFVPRHRPVGICVLHLSAASARARFGRFAAAALARLERQMLERDAPLCAISQASRAEVRARSPRALEIAHVGVGISETLFEQARCEQGYVLFCGRLDIEHKGIDTLLDAFALLATEHPTLTLRIAGGGKDAARVQTLVAERGLQARVALLGRVPDDSFRRLYSGALVQLMPSRFEGFGLVAAEALAAGTPLVASTAGALPEVIADAGVLVPPEDPRALAAAVSVLLRRPEERLRLSALGRRRAERYRWQSAADAHLAFIEKIASRSA
jgi:glycosyltransferase involved in cell wall biosynthesis